jgi:hypothetical protein
LIESKADVANVKRSTEELKAALQAVQQDLYAAQRNEQAQQQQPFTNANTGSDVVDAEVL